MHFQLWRFSVPQSIGRARLIPANHSTQRHRIDWHIICLSYGLSAIWVLLHVNRNLRHYMDDAALRAYFEIDWIGI